MIHQFAQETGLTRPTASGYSNQKGLLVLHGVKVSKENMLRHGHVASECYSLPLSINIKYLCPAVSKHKTHRMKSILTSLFSLVLCATLHAQLPSYVPADGLVGWWPFNGNANDESGNGRNGLISGAQLTADRYDNVGKALQFDGIDDRITVGQFNSPPLSDAEITISAWIKTDYSSADAMVIVGCRGNGPTSLSLQPGDFITCTYGDIAGGFHNLDTYTVDVQDNNWHQLVMIYHNQIKKLFIDGILISETPESFQLLVNGLLEFGRDYPYNRYYTGMLDDIAIYNRALTPAEITQLYTGAEEPVATCAPLAPNLQNGLVGYWPFCGNANDESGNGNDGVVNGATLAEDRFGNAGSAYSFDGNDGITMPPSDILNIALSDFSISLFMKPSNSDGLKNIIGKRYYSLGNGYSVNIENGRVFSELLDANSTTYTGSTTEVALNEWQHVCATFDRDGYSSIYLNGQLEGSLPILNESGDLSNSSELFIGYFAPVGPDCFNGCLFFEGLLDDIAIYNRALTPAEIAQLYTGAAAPCNLIASETQDTPLEVGGSAQMYVTLNATDYSMQWQTNAAGLGWMDVQDNNTYTGSQTQNLLVSNASLANHEQPFRIIVTDGICNDTSDVALLLVNNTCTAYDTITTTVEVFDTLTIENVVEVYDTLTIYNTIDVFDTTTVTVEVFDTITNVIDVFDTTTIYLQVDIFDTLFIDVYDTTYVVNTIDVYDTTFVTVTDTTFIQVVDTSYVTVTDTLLIDITFVGFEGQPSWLNTVLVYPNPTSDHITIDYGNFALMAGYNTVITNAAGATVYSSAVNSQQAYIDINAWGAAGVYFMSVYDVNGTAVAVRQIVLE
jgi:hypothetical protein